MDTPKAQNQSTNQPFSAWRGLRKILVSPGEVTKTWKCHPHPAKRHTSICVATWTHERAMVSPSRRGQQFQSFCQAQRVVLPFTALPRRILCLFVIHKNRKYCIRSRKSQRRTTNKRGWQDKPTAASTRTSRGSVFPQRRLGILSRRNNTNYEGCEAHGWRVLWKEKNPQKHLCHSNFQR